MYAFDLHFLLFFKEEHVEVPADWKLANVIPIYKEGVKEEPGNCKTC